MEIDDSSLFREVQQIMSSGEKPVHFSWEVKIYANDEVIIPLNTLSLDFEQDYLNNYADFILLEVILPAGTYAKRLYPYLDNIDIEIIKKPIGEMSETLNEDTGNQSERYTATMLESGNPIVEAATRNTPNEDDMNLSPPLNVQFQLTNKSLEKLRMVSVGGRFRDVTGEDVIKGLMTRSSKSVNVDQRRKVKGVDMVPASNQEVRSHVIIPDGLPLVQLPHHIHYYCGGIYSTGIGYYLQNDHWYIFPCFDTTRFNDGAPTLTVINIPPNRFPGVERTYRKDGDNLVVLATGQTKFADMRNATQLNAGNGVRFADASRMMDGFSETKGNKTIASRAKNNSEFISDERKNNQNMVLSSARPINDNPYVEYSALAARQGSLITLTWENANRALLYPGMPTKVQYLDGDDIKELLGVLLHVHEYSNQKEAGLVASRFSSNVMLGVFVKPLDDDETLATS